MARKFKVKKTRGGDPGPPDIDELFKRINDSWSRSAVSFNPLNLLYLILQMILLYLLLHLFLLLHLHLMNHPYLKNHLFLNLDLIHLFLFLPLNLMYL